MAYKLPKTTKDHPMAVVCAWCGDFLYWSRCVKPDKTSHGICGPCKAREFEKQLDLLFPVNKPSLGHAIGCRCSKCINGRLLKALFV